MKFNKCNSLIFILTIVHIGIYPASSQRDYWNENPILTDAQSLSPSFGNDNSTYCISWNWEYKSEPIMSAGDILIKSNLKVIGKTAGGGETDQTASVGAEILNRLNEDQLQISLNNLDTNTSRQIQGRIISREPFITIPDSEQPLVFDSDLSLLTPEMITNNRTLSVLTSNQQKVLQSFDFKEMNHPFGSELCWACLGAALNDVSVIRQLKRLKLDIQNLPKVNMSTLISYYKEMGFQDTRILVSRSSSEEILDYLRKKVGIGKLVTYALAYSHPENVNVNHIVLLRTWKNGIPNSPLEYLITDFHWKHWNILRFQNELPKSKEYALVLIRRKNKVVSYENIKKSLKTLNGTISLKGCYGKRVIGFVASWSEYQLELDRAALYTNLVFAYAQMDKDGNLKISKDTTAYQNFLGVMTARYALSMKGIGISISASIGGWSNSEYLSRIIANETTRHRFVEIIYDFIIVHGFDGIDIAWEYPVSGGPTEGIPEDKANFVHFIRKLRHQLGSTKLISITVGGAPDLISGIDTKELVKHVDWIAVTAYDYYGAWDSIIGSYVGPNAPLRHSAPEFYSGKLNVNWTIRHFVCKSQQPQKIVLGVPFYGRYWAKTNDGPNPIKYPQFRLAEPIRNKFGGVISYDMLKKTWLKSGSRFQINWDAETKTPWAFDPNYTVFVSYDDEKSLEAKIAYAIQKNLGGVMAWSINQDNNKSDLSRTLSKICAPSEDKIDFWCNQLNEKRWWSQDSISDSSENIGLCGKRAPLFNGYYPHCDPDDLAFSCCSNLHNIGKCGSGPDFCNCTKCVDYSKNPEKLLAEPTRPDHATTQVVSYYTGISSTTEVYTPEEPNPPYRRYNLNLGHCGIDTSFSSTDINQTNPINLSWLVALSAVQTHSAKRSIFCGGSLITSRHVLTAASCVYDKEFKDIEVILNPGSLNMTTHKIDTKRVHPIFNGESNMANVAILRLATSVPEDVPLACLDRANTNHDHKFATAIKFGKQKELSGTNVQNVTSSRVQILGASNCRQNYDIPLASSFVCLGEIREYFLSSDSGGPLIINNINSEQMIQIGVASFEFGIEKDQKISYSRVARFYNWIKQNTAF